MKNLEILKEECSEVIKCCCKISRFGFNDYNPNDPLKIINIEKLEKECADILAIIDILIDNGILTIIGLENSKQSKFEKLKLYYNRQ